MKIDGICAEVDQIFQKKARKLRIVPRLDLHLIENASIVDAFVYGEAFPDQNRVWLEIVAFDASIQEITEIICHELIHIKFPKISHDCIEFDEKMKACMQD